MIRILLLALLLLPGPAQAAPDKEEPKGFDDLVKDLPKMAGLLEIYPDQDGGRILVALPATDEKGLSLRMLYGEALAAGLGSNPVNLDRSQQSEAQVVAFRMVGGKVRLEVENWSYVARNAAQEERDSVLRSFASSTLWAGKPLAKHDDGRILIDLSGFLLMDLHGVSATLKSTKQGSFSLDGDASAVDATAALCFPENVELEAHLVFRSKEPGSEVQQTSPDPRSINLIQHVSFLRLPDDNYQPRKADPRGGQLVQPVQDYGSSLSDPVLGHLALRHRLQKTDPTAAQSKVKQPIVYYLDRGTPEPVRQALLDGAGWWAKAFDAAGFVDAFRVEMLPEGVHPLDARYSVIHWVHRATRGWSYGGFLSDPRTGEIVRGNVLLGSLRVRQDRMIFEGLVGADKTGQGGVNDPLEAALARIRQLGAHEVGHAIGLGHNMGASSQQRASVMDYPAPEIRIENGDLNLRDAYAVGAGSWDHFAIRALYSEFAPAADEEKELEAIHREGIQQGLRYVADGHARPWGSGHPRGSLWDTGDDAVTSLRHHLKVREIALASFAQRALPEGRPRSELRERLVPIYLFHRFQLQAAAKFVGGVDFNYGIPGDGNAQAQVVSVEKQRDALEALLDCLDTSTLLLPEDLLAGLDPHEPGFLVPGVGRELFSGGGAPSFELERVATVAIRLLYAALLHPDRLNRVEEHYQRDTNQLSLRELLNRCVKRSGESDIRTSARGDAMRESVQQELATKLMELANSAQATSRVRSEAQAALVELGKKSGNKDLRAEIKRYQNRAYDQPMTTNRSTPPGSPIGCADWHGPIILDQNPH